jgi:uncharacterized membrane protein
VAVIGLVGGIVLLRFVSFPLALVGGWDAAALTFLGTVWPIISRADGAHVEQLATREDETRISATALLIGASVASLLGVGLALSLAGKESGTTRVLLIGVALVTVMLSWTVVNTVFTLRYAHLHYASSAGGIAFAGPAGPEQPNYRDFAYVAFTIGMTYQVSDTGLLTKRFRRVLLVHAFLAYLFGVVIIAAVINVIAGLVN